MRLDLSLDLLVNAAGGLLFVLAGAWALSRARGARRATLVGWSSVLFGATFVIQNLVRDHDLLTAYGFSAIAGAAAASIVALGADAARGLPRRARTRIVVLGVVTAIVTAILSIVAHVYPDPKAANGFRADVHGSVEQAAIAAILPAATFLVAACAERWRALGPGDAKERRALAALATGFGLPTVFFTTFIATGGTIVIDSAAAIVASVSFATIAASMLVGAVHFLDASSDARLGRRTFAIHLAAGFAALAVNLSRAPLDGDFGAFGISRTIGVSFLVVAIVRYDLLGVPLPRLAARRGTIATAALATLLIVAQVGQNFLTAEYGLLMGGVVAGAFLFAAAPLQRAMERLSVAPAQAAPQPPGGDARRREEIYLNAARLAMRDRRLTRAEEAHLHALAEELGLGAKRAHELLVQAETEAGVR